jgi:peptidoglycan/LPS O-acetylase OafA/YrhL
VRNRLVKIFSWSLGLLVPVLALRLVSGPIPTYLGLLIEQWILSVAVAGSLVFLWNNPKSQAARLLAKEPMPYLGKISYGLYVFHLPCLVASSVIFSFMPRGNAIPALAMTIGISMLSWRFFESPINDLKRHFSYSRLGGRAGER